MKRAALLVALLVGCAGGDDPPSGGPVLGRFQVGLVPELTAGSTTTPAYTSLIGKIYDGVQPDAIVWETQASSGGCTLRTPRVPFCATPCGAAVCVEDDTCRAYATAQSVGTVTVTGLATTAGATSFTIDPIANGYQPPAGTQLAYPAFAEGAPITVTAAGSAFAGRFTVTTHGVAPLGLTSTDFALRPDQPLALAWTAAAAPAQSQLHVKLDISHHGGSKGALECDLPDTGAASIDAALVTQLLALGAAGYPTIIVTRAATGATAIGAGSVELVASSTVEHAVDVPGVVSCTESSQCPPDQTCQPDLTCK